MHTPATHRSRSGARTPAGFTLIELIVTVAIAAILLGVAVPSFLTVVQDAKLRELVEPTRRALMIARSEATRSRSDVTVCPRANDTQCGTDWNNGLLVFVDSTTVLNETTAVMDASDRVLMIVPPHDSENTLRAIASKSRTVSDLYDPNFVRYRPSGYTDWQNGTLIACDTDRGLEHSRALNVTLTGSVQEARPGSGDVVLDAFRREIECP